MWATVNVCGPGQVGVRASVPGNGTGQRLYARFSAQYFDAATRTWASAAGNSRSPWLYAGSAHNAAGQVGWTFAVRAPAGAKVRLRGVAELQWRAGGKVVRSASLLTRGGIAGVDFGAASRASCQPS